MTQNTLRCVNNVDVLLRRVCHAAGAAILAIPSPTIIRVVAHSTVAETGHRGRQRNMLTVRFVPWFFHLVIIKLHKNLGIR